MIDEQILKMSLPKMTGLTIEDIRIGLGYTAVKNSAGGVGLAYTLRENLPCTCSLNPMAGGMAGWNLEKAAMLFSDKMNALNSAIGLAAINSVINEPSLEGIDGDLMEVLKIEKSDWVGMVGHFKPVEKAIKKITPHLFIIDNRPEYQKNGKYKIFDEILAGCDVVIITATTLINKTLGDIIKKTKNARVRALLGPSTPLVKEAFEKEGINIISGMIINDNDNDRDRVMDIVTQGGGTMNFKKFCRKINIGRKL